MPKSLFSVFSLAKESLFSLCVAFQIDFFVLLQNTNTNYYLLTSTVLVILFSLKSYSDQTAVEFLVLTFWKTHDIQIENIFYTFSVWLKAFSKKLHK